MKVLCILTENPNPPRNGITIPTFNQIKVFESLGYELDLINIEELIDKEIVTRRNYAKVIDELTGKAPFFSIFLNKEYIESYLKNSGPFDIIYYSPISVSNVANEFLNYQIKIYNKKPYVISSISDCYTSVLDSYKRRNNFEIKNVPHMLRSFYIGYYERKILNQADIVLVQTRKDKEWIQKIGCETDILIYTNGVDSSLFELSYSFNKNLVFVANLKYEFYRDKLKWFIKLVWKDIIIEHPDAYLYVYTGGNAHNLDEFKSYNVILINEFVKNISDVYDGKSIGVAPIFKNYGFINKVAEAMASGLVVVGDETAFNGMDGLDLSLSSNDPKSFSSTILSLLNDESKLSQQSDNMRKYAKENFSWSSRNKGFLEYLSNLDK